MDHGEGVEGADVVVVGIGFDEQKPEDFDHLGNQEHKLSRNHHPPALAIRDAVSEHETAHPDDKGDHGELPQIDEGDGQQFQSVDELQDHALRPVLEEFKGRCFVFNERNLDKKQEEGGYAQQYKQEPFVGTE